MARIGIAGLQHETNTFSPQPATLRDFLQGSGWPGLLSGPSLLATVAPMNLPIAGAAAALSELGHEIVPLVWAAATPSGRVTDEAFDDISARLRAALDAAGPLDGLYLDLHGAMATASHDDGEGELLRRLRAQLGEALPIVASLDYHANVSRQMVALADGLVGYRSYPHIDMSDTGARAARFLHERLARGRPYRKAWRQLDFLIPLTSQCTLAEPAAGTVQALADTERELGLASCSWLGGFALTDIPDCGQTVLAYGDDTGQAEQAVTRLARHLAAAEPAFNQPILDDDDAAAHALRHAGDGGPIILADTQDNPGGGGASDTTGLLRALIRHGAPSAVVATVCDPAAAQAAHQAGVGATLRLALGGRTALADGTPGQPCEAEFVVERVTDGRFTGTGPMWLGAPIDLGPTALLRVGGVRVIVASEKMQAADQSLFRHVGIDPARCGILALKSSVHFRADFQAMAREIIVVASPGLVYSRLREIPYANLRAGVRVP
ncbi:MlrC [plant metagenome]|uniref:MlrC n=1 Tax=plant metagenome TaxID=1297885 RepID=A0A484SVF0_9ZZZZ